MCCMFLSHAGIIFCIFCFRIPNFWRKDGSNCIQKLDPPFKSEVLQSRESSWICCEILFCPVIYAASALTCIWILFCVLQVYWVQDNLDKPKIMQCNLQWDTVELLSSSCNNEWCGLGFMPRRQDFEAWNFNQSESDWSGGEIPPWHFCSWRQSMEMQGPKKRQPWLLCQSHQFEYPRAHNCFTSGSSEPCCLVWAPVIWSEL